MWWTILSVVCLILGVWALSGFFKGMKRVQAAEQEVEREMGEISLLSAVEAEGRAGQLLESKALKQDWASPLPVELDSRIKLLDSRLDALLRRYRRIIFQESGTEISSEFLLSNAAPEGISLIGTNPKDGYELGVNPRSPTLYEIANGRIREQYPSIFHFLLLVEGN